MEFDANNSEPKSICEVLVQQVNEKSNLCDVTVKMGLWEKKFHRCVLVISPFFDHVLNENFREGQTGVIEITEGTPDAVEATIMFLYGKKPEFNDTNIENILDMAEFLLMPNLKSACIAWLNAVSITRDNCLNFLQLSSIYGFEIQRCTTYIEQHLPEMLQVSQMVSLTKDSIHLLFSDKRLSYVPMDDKLLFLLKWLDANPNNRKVHMKELLANLDFNSISNQCLQVFLNNPEAACHIQIEHKTNTRSKDHRVLIMSGGEEDGVFWCLDLERDQWFRVESISLKEEIFDLNEEMYVICAKTTRSIVCFVRGRYFEDILVLLDLPTDACTQLKFTQRDGEFFKLKHHHRIKIYRQACIVSENKRIKRTPYLDDVSRLQNINQRLSWTGLTSYDQSSGLNKKTTSTLYIGHIGHSNVEMSPLFSFKDEVIDKFAISENVIAFIFKSQTHVAFFDLNEGHLERKHQTTSSIDEIAPIEGGFVIYDNKRCITLTRMQSACLSPKYQVDKISLEHKYFKELKYFICNQIIYRYYRENNGRQFIFECTPFQALVSLKSIAWKQLPLPTEVDLYTPGTIDKMCFEISLPKSMLRCHVECPHCKITSREKISGQRYYWECNYFLRDSSSDDDLYAASYTETRPRKNIFDEDFQIKFTK